LNRIFNHNEILPEEDEIDGIQIIRIPFFGSSRYALAPSVLKFVFNFDIIHIHSSDFFLDFLAITKFIHKKKLVLHSHGLFFHTNFAQFFKKLYFHTITSISGNLMDAILCVSKKDHELLGKIIPSKKLFLIPNGISNSSYSQPQTDNRDPNMMISVGRLSTNKRYDLLIYFLAEIIKDAPDMTLYIIGKDFGELSNIEALIYRLSIQDHIKILGEISDVELRNYLKKAKFWISTSEYESFGVALLEAMASGCIPIVSDIPAYNELITNKQNGFVINFHELNHSRQNYNEIMNLNNNHCAEIQKINFRKVEIFRWEFIVDKIFQIYENL